MIEYHNPEADTGIEHVPYTLSAAITGADTVNIGFLANGFPDSEVFLEELAAAMQAIEPAIQVFAYNKGNATVAANEEMLTEITSQCAAAVAAYGH
jgi:hypothetical protein